MLMCKKPHIVEYLGHDMNIPEATVNMLADLMDGSLECLISRMTDDFSSTYNHETTWKQTRKVGNATLFSRNVLCVGCESILVAALAPRKRKADNGLKSSVHMITFVGVAYCQRNYCCSP